MEVIHVSEQEVNETDKIKDEVVRLRKTLDYNLKTSQNAIKDFKKELNDKEIDLERAGFKLDDLDAKLDYQIRENEKFLQELKEKDRIIKENISQLKAKTQENENLLVELESIKEQLKTNETMFGDMEKSLLSEKDAREKLDESYSKLEYEFRNFRENEISKFETDIEFKVNNINDLENKASEMERDNIRLKESFASFENDSTSRLEMLKELLEKEKKKTENYRDLVENLHETKGSLEEAKTELEIERKSNKEMMENFEKIDSKNKELENNQAKLQLLNSELMGINEKLESRNLVLEENNGNLKSSEQEHQGRIVDLESEITNKISEIDEYREKYDSLVNDFDIFKKEKLREHERAIEEKNIRIDELNNKISRREGENATLVERLAGLEKENAISMEQLGGLQDKNRELEAFNQEILEKLENSQNSLKETNETIQNGQELEKELREKILGLETMHKDFNEKIPRYEADLAGKKVIIQELKARISKLEDTNGELRETNGHLEQENGSKLTVLKDRLEKEKEKYSALEAKFKEFRDTNLAKYETELKEKLALIKQLENSNALMDGENQKLQDILNNLENESSSKIEVLKELYEKEKDKYEVYLQEIDEKKNLIQGLEDNLKGEQNTISELTIKISSLEGEISKINEEKSRSLEEIKALEGAAKAKEGDIASLKGIIREKENKVHELVGRIDDFHGLESTMVDLQKEIVSLRSENEDMIEQIEFHQGIIEKKVGKLENLQTYTDVLEKTQKDMGDELEEQTTINADLQKGIVLTKNEISNLKFDREKLRERLMSIERERSRLEDQNDELSQDQKINLDRITALEDEFELMVGENQKLHRKYLESQENLKGLEDLESQKISFESEKKEIFNQMESQKGLIEDMTRQIESLESLKNLLENDLKEFDSKLIQKENIISDLQEEIASARAGNSEILSEKEELMAELDALKEEKSSQANLNDELTQNLKINLGRIISLEEELDSTVREKMELEGKVEESREKHRELEDLQTQNLSMESENNRILKEMESQKGLMGEMTRQIESLESQKSEMENNFNEFESKLTHKENIISDLQEAISSARAGNSEILSEKEELMAELDALKEEKSSQTSLNDELTNNLKINLGRIISLEDELDLIMGENQELNRKSQEYREKLKDLEDLQSQHLSMEALNEENLHKLEFQKNLIEDMTNKIDGLESQNDEHDKNRIDSEAKIQEKEKTISGLQEEISSMRQEISTLNEEKDDIKHELDAREKGEKEAQDEMSRELDGKEKRIQNLENKIIEKEDEFRKMGEELSRVKSKLDEIVSLNQNLTDKNREYNELLEIKNEKEENLHSSINEKEVIINKMQKEVEEFEIIKNRNNEFKQKVNEVLSDRKWDNIVVELDHFDKYLEKNNLSTNPFQTKIQNDALFINKDADAINRIFRALKHNQSALTFLIGPSGSGKTENADFIIKNLPDEYLHWHSQLYRQDSKELAIAIMEKMDKKFAKTLKDRGREEVISTFLKIISALSRKERKLFCIFDQGELFSKDSMEFIINNSNPDLVENRAFNGLIMAVPRFEKKLDRLMEIYDTALKRSIVREYTRPFNLSQTVELMGRKMAFGKGLDFKEVLKNRDFRPFQLDSIQCLYEISLGHPSTLNDLGYISLEIASKISPDSPITESVIQEAWRAYPNKKLHEAAIKWYKEKDLFEQ